MLHCDAVLLQKAFTLSGSTLVIINVMLTHLQETDVWKPSVLYVHRCKNTSVTRFLVLYLLQRYKFNVYFSMFAVIL